MDRADALGRRLQFRSTGGRSVLVAEVLERLQQASDVKDPCQRLDVLFPSWLAGEFVGTVQDTAQSLGMASFSSGL